MEMQAPAAQAPEQLIDPRIRAQGSWKIFWRFFRYLLPLWDKAILVILMTFIGTPLSQISVFIGRFLVDEVILATNKTGGWRMTMFFIIVGVQVLLWLINRTMYFVRQVMSLAIDVRITARLWKTFYKHLHTLSVDFFRTRPIGEHMYRTGEVGGLLNIIHYDGVALVDMVYRIIWGAVLVSVVDWRITALVLLNIVPYTILNHWAYTYFQRVDFDQRRRNQRLTASLRESVAGIKTVKAYGKTSLQLLKYTHRVVISQRIQIKRFFLSILMHYYVIWFYNWSTDKAKWLYIAWQTMNGNLSIGEFSVMFWLVGQLEYPMEAMVRHFQNIRLHMVPAMRVLETLDVEPEIVDPPAARAMPPIEGRVELRNVTHEYVPGQRALDDVNIALEPGTFAAFVGPSGSGKSTVTNLLMRLYEQKEGEVLVDGIDIRTVKIRSLLDQIGVVLPETVMFGGTLADNIAYGDLKADEETLMRAVDGAELHSFVARLPNGITTDLGEGAKLSGGEKQRVGLARALIRDPRIMILDGPTASLDSRTEIAVLRTLKKAMQGRTTLMISHRLVLVQDAEVIFVMDRGRIVEQGKHDALLALGGLYASMWREQMATTHEPSEDDPKGDEEATR
ncbi:MAG: ABC transporter ATP-binding protein [Armatimonadetes bacterium]|nr:ABC transporter ATP-binding protein [Armatimonadota bacterium]